MDDIHTRLFIKTVMIHHKNFPNRDFYPFNLKVFQNTDRLDFNHEVTFFVGENGTGKSTLLESLAKSYGLTVWGGEKVHITHHNPYETAFHRFLSIKSRKSKGFIEKGFLFRSENFFNYACYVDDLAMYDPDILKYYGGKSFHEQSHGEAFLAFLEHRCAIEGLYLMDEPEAALSPSNQLAFIKILRRIAEGGQAQFIISTHSPIILGYTGAQILSFDHDPIKEIAYEETQSYRFYRSFLNDRRLYLGAVQGPEAEKERNDG